MKVKKILEKYEALQEFSGKELDFCVALIIADNISALKNAVEVAQKKENEIIEKNVARDENGEKIVYDQTRYKLKDGNTYSEDMNALMENEVEVTLKKIPKDVLSGCKVRPRDVAALMDLLD